MYGEKFFSKHSKNVVVDLDAIVEKTQYVKFHGKVHEVKPIEVGEFFVMANALASIEMLKKTEKPTVDDVVNAYYGVIMPACPSITRAMIREATHAQVSALLKFVLDHTNGRITDEKKKTLTKMEAPSPLVMQM